MRALQRLSQGRVLLMAVCAAGIGGTFQFGYNLSVISAPTLQSFLVNNVFVVATVVLFGFSHRASSFEMAMMGRLLVGVSAGVSMNVWGRVRPRSRGRDPSHLHCPRDRNGQVVGLRELLGGPQAWPLLLASCLAPGLLQLASLLPLPESPSYLLIDRGDPEACLAALQRLRGTSDLVLELAELEEERAACQGLRARRPWELFHDGTLQRQVTSLVVLGSAMELCGNDPVYACASSVFLEAGVPQEKVQYAIIRTGCCELLSAFFSEGLSHLLYVPFLGICVCGAIYAGFFLPETRGKVILEIS